MKKSLFALAAVGAFAGAAQAQSSVTVYGIFDTGWAGGNERATSGGTVRQATVSQIQASGGQSSNRLGFRGVEDLGGGTSAKFVLESSLQANQDAWQPTWRQAWAGLAQKGMGEVRIGTQNSMIWQLAAGMTVGQLNNFAGSVINPTNMNANASSGIAGRTNPNASAVAESRQNDANSIGGFTNRTQRTIQIESERMAGFQAKAMYMLNNSDSTYVAQGTSTLGYTAGQNNQNGWGVSLDYTGIKNFRIAGAYQSFNSVNPYGATQSQINNGTTYTTGALSICPGNAVNNTNTTTNAVTNCSNIRDNQAYAAATYNFGILTAYVNYINRKAISQQNANVYLSRTAQEIGVRGNLTKTVEGWASVGNGRYQSFGANQPTANFTGYQVGTSYMMSKRTNLYAIYGQTGTSSTTSGLSANVNNYGIGVRHTF